LKLETLDLSPSIEELPADDKVPPRGERTSTRNPAGPIFRTDDASYGLPDSTLRLGDWEGKVWRNEAFSVERATWHEPASAVSTTNGVGVPVQMPSIDSRRVPVPWAGDVRVGGWSDASD